MQLLGWDELEAHAAELDALVAQTPFCDGFCSSSAWVLPARLAFAADAVSASCLVDGGMLTLLSRQLDDGQRILTALEAQWGLACPLLGPRARPLVDGAMALLTEGTASERPRALVLSGLAPGSDCVRLLEEAARRRRRRVQVGPPMLRVSASLTGGVDGFWARRSAKFRATTRRARRAAQSAGITYERHVPDPTGLPAVWQRVMEVETRSRKAVIGGGLSVPEMQLFYQHMLPRLAARGACRVVFAQRGADDLAYVMGGLFATASGVEYRGLQVSFDDRFAAESPGVLVHVEMIEWLCQGGVIAYDLGSDMPYKHRWGEAGLTTRIYVLGG